MAYKRRSFLINKKFQLTIIGFNLGIATAAIIVFYLASDYLFKKFTQQDSEMASDPVIAEMIAEEALRFKLVFGSTAFVVLLLIVVGGLILSHRVAGPIYRLDQHMKGIIEGGEVRDVKFRKNDFFPEVADSFNKMLKKLRG